MYSDNSWDSDDVCVIRRSIFEAVGATMSQHFAEFLRLACGVTASKGYLFAQEVDRGFAAIAVCPPFAVVPCKPQRDARTEADFKAVCTAVNMKEAKEGAARKLLQQLCDCGYMDRFTAMPTALVRQPCIEWTTAGGGRGQPVQIPLRVSGMQIEQFDRFCLPPGVPLHHVCAAADLAVPAMSDHDSVDPIVRLLFPGGPPHEPAVVGFDVEWRPGGRGGAFHGSGGSMRDQHPGVPVAVLQLSSEHANVVVNTVALGRSMLGNASDHAACTAGAACARAVLESETLKKVGLQCDEDVRRLQQAIPECRFRNIHDIKGLTDELRIQKTGLRSLVATLLQRRMSKGEQCADWQTAHLSDEMVEYAALDAYATRLSHNRLVQIKHALVADAAVRLPNGDTQPPPPGRLRAWLHDALQDDSVAGAGPAASVAAANAARANVTPPASPQSPRIHAAAPAAAARVLSDSPPADDFGTPVEHCQPVRGMRSRRGGTSGRLPAKTEQARMRGAGNHSGSDSGTLPAAESMNDSVMSGGLMPHARARGHTPQRPMPMSPVRGVCALHSDARSEDSAHSQGLVAPKGQKRAELAPSRIPRSPAHEVSGAGYGKGHARAEDVQATRTAVRQNVTDAPMGVGRGQGAGVTAPGPKCMNRMRGAGAADRGTIAAGALAVAPRIGGRTRISRGGHTHAPQSRARPVAVDVGLFSPEASRVVIAEVENDFGVPQGLQKPSRRGGLSRASGTPRQEVFRGIANSPEPVRTKGGKGSPQGGASAGSRVSVRVSPATTKEDPWSRPSASRACGSWNRGGAGEWVGKTGDNPMRSPGANTGARRTKSRRKGTQRVRNMIGGEDAAARHGGRGADAAAKALPQRRRADPVRRRLPARMVREASREVLREVDEAPARVCGDQRGRRGSSGGGAAAEAGGDGDASPRLPWYVEQFDVRSMPNEFYVRAHERAQREFDAMTPPPVKSLAEVTAGSTGRLPIAAPSKGYFDVIEAYFATVEAVVDGGAEGAEWLRAWHVPEFKASDLYQRMLAYYGGP